MSIDEEILNDYEIEEYNNLVVKYRHGLQDIKNIELGKRKEFNFDIFWGAFVYVSFLFLLGILAVFNGWYLIPWLIILFLIFHFDKHIENIITFGKAGKIITKNQEIVKEVKEIEARINPEKEKLREIESKISSHY